MEILISAPSTAFLYLHRTTDWDPGMNNGLVLRQTPEDEELGRKLTELTALETELVQRELDLSTLHAQLHSFEREYLQIIGSRYTELERIEAQITEYTTYLQTSRGFKPSESLKNFIGKLPNAFTQIW